MVMFLQDGVKLRSEWTVDFPFGVSFGAGNDSLELLKCIRTNFVVMGPQCCYFFWGEMLVSPLEGVTPFFAVIGISLASKHFRGWQEMKVLMVGYVKTSDQERRYVILFRLEKLVRQERNLPAAEVDSTASRDNIQASKCPCSDFEVDEVDRWPVSFSYWFGRGMQGSGCRQFRSSLGMGTNAPDVLQQGEFDARGFYNLFYYPEMISSGCEMSWNVVQTLRIMHRSRWMQDWSELIGVTLWVEILKSLEDRRTILLKFWRRTFFKGEMVQKSDLINPGWP